jgi:phage regulator Rha-like protein
MLGYLSIHTKTIMNSFNDEQVRVFSWKQNYITKFKSLRHALLHIIQLTQHHKVGMNNLMKILTFSIEACYKALKLTQ